MRTFRLRLVLLGPQHGASYLEIVVLIYQLSPGPKNCRKPLFLMSRSLNKVAQHSFKSCLTLKKRNARDFCSQLCGLLKKWVGPAHFLREKPWGRGWVEARKMGERRRPVSPQLPRVFAFLFTERLFTTISEPGTGYVCN